MVRLIWLCPNVSITTRAGTPCTSSRVAGVKLSNMPAPQVEARHLRARMAQVRAARRSRGYASAQTLVTIGVPAERATVQAAEEIGGRAAFPIQRPIIVVPLITGQAGFLPDGLDSLGAEFCQLLAAQRTEEGRRIAAV